MNDADFEGLEGEDGMVAEEAASDGEGIDVSCKHTQRTCLPHSSNHVVGVVPVATCSCSDEALAACCVHAGVGGHEAEAQRTRRGGS